VVSAAPRSDTPAIGWAAAAGAAAHVIAPDLPDERVVDGDDGHHLERVRRLRPPETITMADGRGSWRCYTVAETGPGWLRLVATGTRHAEPVLTPGLAVAFALTKADKPELVVQKLTELGADRILPVMARRSVARWGSDRARDGVERLRRVAREAAAQAHRARVPVVEELVLLSDLAGQPGLVVADRDGRGAAPPPAPGGEWLLVVGPEGGLEPEELDELGPATRIGIGPHVLRAETAALAGAAVLTLWRKESRVSAGPGTR
jgi:16S rRNA (uracil1498-N3)-methyltransferase